MREPNLKKIQKKYRELPAEELLRIVCQAADRQKAQDLLVLDVRGLASFADYFVLISGTSTRHVQGLADGIDTEIGSKRMKSGTTEGLAEGNWVLLDYGDIIVHIFYHETRQHYDLEGLWHDAPRIDPSTLPLPPEAETEKRGQAGKGRSTAGKTKATGATVPAKAGKSAAARKTARAIKIAASRTRSAEAKKASIIAKKKVAGKKASGNPRKSGGMQRPAAPTKKKTGTGRK